MDKMLINYVYENIFLSFISSKYDFFLILKKKKKKKTLQIYKVDLIFGRKVIQVPIYCKQ
jgi:hypothetical protein